MAEKLHALVLRTHPYRETSLLLTLFCRERGKVRGVVRGVRGKKGPAKAALQPGNLVTCEGTRKPGWELWSFSKTDGLIHRQAKSSGASMATAFLLDLTDRLWAEEEGEERVFRLLDKAIACLEDLGTDPDQVRQRDDLVVWCLAWMLRLAGFLPDLGHCSDCQDAAGGKWRADRLGHLACARCSGDGVPLSGAERQALRALMGWDPLQGPFAQEEGLPAAFHVHTEALLMHIARAHLGSALPSHQAFRAAAPLGK